MPRCSKFVGQLKRFIIKIFKSQFYLNRMGFFDRFRLSSFRKVSGHGFSIYFWDYSGDHHRDNNYGGERFFYLPLHLYHIPVSRYHYRIQNDLEYIERYVFYPQSSTVQLLNSLAKFLGP